LNQVNDCAWGGSIGPTSARELPEGKKRVLAPDRNRLFGLIEDAKLYMPDPRLFVPFPLVVLQNMTRTTSSLWLSVQDLQDLSLESSVAGSARLILLLADLRLVQCVLDTKLSLCRSSPDRPHFPRTQPDGQITRTNDLKCDSGGPSLHRYRVIFNPKHRLLCSASIACNLRSLHRSGLCSNRLNRFKAKCT